MDLKLINQPDMVKVQTEAECLTAERSGEEWLAGHMIISPRLEEGGLAIHVAADLMPLHRVILRWRQDIPAGVRILGDDWERGYGELEWRGIVPERLLPWYALVHDGCVTHGVGVMTGAASFACWTIDAGGVNLILDLRNGGEGVMLGGRALVAARVCCREGVAGESPFRAAQAFCRQLCPTPRLPDHPVYGSNNWYYAYGVSSHDEIIGDTKLLVDYAPAIENRPYMVIDAGWQAKTKAPGGVSWCGGPWDSGNADFPDMPGLAAEMTAIGARPGIWVRPLASAVDEPEELLLSKTRVVDRSARGKTLDPSCPEVLARVEADFALAAEWGYRMIKHDWTTCDIFGRWGFQMGMAMTNPGWHFQDRGKTTAEIILELYRAMRRGAGEALVIGCNTVSHLSAGIFDIQRTGDDTSGKKWEQTRKMGVNTLAFRMSQHNTFYAHDADCVGLTAAVDWTLNRQWLDVLARSGTPLFVSADPSAVGAEQAAALKAAFAVAAEVQPVAEPLDWLDTTCPTRWNIAGEEVVYDWTGPAGVDPQMWSRIRMV